MVTDGGTQVEAAGEGPLTRAILLLGDQWNLLILQRAFADHFRRFSQWSSLGVSESVLADRLSELVGEGIFEMVAYQSANRQRHEYRLTEKGLALWEFLVAIWSWENRWVASRRQFPSLVHADCGEVADPSLGCAACGATSLSARDTITHEGTPGALSAGPRQRYHRRSSRRPDAAVSQYHPETLDVLGNRWSILVLGLAFLRVRNFADFKARLDIAPSVLSSRLRQFVDLGILAVGAGGTGRSRDYRLTEKGLDFFAVFACMVDWSDEWLADQADPSDLVIYHRECGERLRPMLVCRCCAQPLTRESVRPGQR